MDYSALALLALAGAAIWSIRQTFMLPLRDQPRTSPDTPLSAGARQSALALEGHVRAIAGAPRNIAHAGHLEAAASYIETALTDSGLRAARHAFSANGVTVRNLEVVFEPSAATDETRTIVVGAHYDTDGNSPGANDNGTGVAALIELACAFARQRPEGAHRLRLVFFVNEEQPYGKTELMGSWRHARALKASGERVAGMIALETLGYFSNRPGSQQLPWPFSWAYGNIGDFVAFVGLPGARPFLISALAAFRRARALPSTGAVVPGFVEGADLSDHWAYAEEGFPALMITDTAPYRNPFYHSAHDTPDTVDYASLACITAGLETMLRTLVQNRT